MAVQVGAEVCFEQVRNRPRSVALLIGAGCSLSAGIPLASGFVDEVRRLYRHRCSRLPDAEANRFNAVVGQLAPDEWLDLFRSEERRVGKEWRTRWSRYDLHGGDQHP